MQASQLANIDETPERLVEEAFRDFIPAWLHSSTLQSFPIEKGLAEKKETGVTDSVPYGKIL